MRLSVLIASLALAGSATAAAAAPDRMFQALPPAACAAALAETGRPLKISEPLDETARGGLLAGTYLALYEPGVGGALAKSVEAATPCPIARFAADDVVWTISAGGADAPLRWVKAPGRNEVFALVKGVGLADAAAWNRGRVGLPGASGPAAYYLVGLVNGQNYVVQIYDAPPSAKVLADDIAPLVEGESAPLTVHDPTGDAVTLFRDTASGSQADLFRPDELGPGRAATFFLPDGRLFTLKGDDYVMRGSGFACRPAYGAFKRDRLAVQDVSDANLDLACQLLTDNSVTTVWVTHLPDASDDKARFERQIRAAEAETGVAKKLANPPTGRNATFAAGRNWLDKDGAVQVDFFIRRGEYVYEIRQSHTREELDAASDALIALAVEITRPPTGDPITDWSRQR